jgi:hypothetical protein
VPKPGGSAISFEGAFIPGGRESSARGGIAGAPEALGTAEGSELSATGGSVVSGAVGAVPMGGGNVLSATGGKPLSAEGGSDMSGGGKVESATGGSPGAAELSGAGGRPLSATGGKDISAAGGGRAPLSIGGSELSGGGNWAVGGKAPDASGAGGSPLSIAGGRPLESPGKPGAAAKGCEGAGSSDWGGKVGEPGFVGFPSGKGGKDKSPEEGAGAVEEAPGNAGIELSVPVGGGRAGIPELSGAAPGAGGMELLAGSPVSGAPEEGKGGRPELSEGEPGAAGGKPLADELSPGRGGSPEEGLLSAPGSGAGVFSPGAAG